MPEDLASTTSVTPPSSRTKTTRWAIRVTYPNGQDAWLRHGASVGVGSVVQFRTKQLAEINVDFIRQGFDDDVTISVVRTRA